MNARRLLRPFASPDEYSDEVRAPVAGLEHTGQTAAAADLREGFACLNGLTDGWAGRSRRPSRWKTQALIEARNPVVDAITLTGRLK